MAAEGTCAGTTQDGQRSSNRRTFTSIRPLLSGGCVRTGTVPCCDEADRLGNAWVEVAGSV